MGIYYYAVDFEKKKYFSAPLNFAIKYPGIYALGNPFCNMIVMRNAKGDNYEICDDYGHDIPPDNDYEDVTEQVFDQYKKLMKMSDKDFDYDEIRWINVKDKLPPKDMPILAVYIDALEKVNLKIGTVYWDDLWEDWKENCGCGGYETEPAYIKITHWMLLPELPKD